MGEIWEWKDFPSISMSKLLQLLYIIPLGCDSASWRWFLLKTKIPCYISIIINKPSGINVFLRFM